MKFKTADQKMGNLAEVGERGWGEGWGWVEGGKGGAASPHLIASTSMALLGPVGCKCSQHSPTTRPSVERTAEKAYLLSDRV